MRSVSIVIVLAACGSATPPPKVVSNSGSGSAPMIKEAAKTSCDGVARLLIAERGFGSIPANNQGGARRGGEAEIVAACTDDQWEPAAIECMASRPSPASCIGQLSQYQERSYEAHLQDWEMNWTKGPGGGMGGDGYGGSMYGGANPCGGGGVVGGVPPQEEWVQCEFGDRAADFEPQIKANAKDHDYAVSVRKAAINLACETRWQNPEKKCFNAAKDAAAIAACRGKLDDGSKNALDNTLADAQAKLDKIVALEKTPKAIECKAVSAAHYSDDAWRGKMVSLSQAERKRVIGESRDKLTKACTDDKWTPVLRACLVGTTKRDMDMMECFTDDKDKGNTQMYRWGFPAGGVSFKTGVFECDQLGEIVKKIGQCDKLEKELRDQLVDSFGSQMGMWMDAYGSRDEMSKSCKETMTMYTDGAKERGCTL